MIILNVDNVCAYYGNAQVLFDVSMELKEKEIVALVGANGAGKTTLLRTISGLPIRRTGEIDLLNQSIIKSDATKIVNLGIAHVPEGRRLFPGMTVTDNLMMGAYLRKEKQAVIEDLDYVFSIFPSLSERKKHLAGKLSGGEQQMCAIGRGIMSSPKVLLIDELSLGLAPVVIDELIKVIALLRERGVSIILVEQDVQTGLEISDRGYVIEHGRIVSSGESEELLSDERIRETYLGI